MITVTAILSSALSVCMCFVYVAAAIRELVNMTTIFDRIQFRPGVARVGCAHAVKSQNSVLAILDSRKSDNKR